jgi:hypothetical protein
MGHSCTPLLVFVSLYGVGATSQCSLHHLPVHQEDSERTRVRVLEPILNSAVLMSRDNDLPDELRLDFAHRLMRTYDRFSQDCIDSSWKHAVAHKLCAAYIRWDRNISKYRAANTSAQSVCIFESIHVLLRACQSHVEPWAHDVGFCKLLPSKCADRNPFWGACSVWGTDRNRRSVTYGHVQDSHQRHGTKLKHSGHRERERVDGHVRYQNHMADRLKHSVNNTGRHNTTIPQQKKEGAKVAVLFDRSVKTWDIRKCAQSGRLLCAPRNMTALVKLLQDWLPGCEIRSIDAPFVGRVINDECGALVLWAPAAERVMRLPCEHVENLNHDNAHRTTVLTYVQDCKSAKQPDNARKWIWEPNDHVYIFKATELTSLEFGAVQTKVCSEFPSIHSTGLTSCNSI